MDPRIDILTIGLEKNGPADNEMLEQFLANLDFTLPVVYSYVLMISKVHIFCVFLRQLYQLAFEKTFFRPEAERDGQFDKALSYIEKKA